MTRPADWLSAVTFVVVRATRVVREQLFVLLVVHANKTQPGRRRLRPLAVRSQGPSFKATPPSHGAVRGSYVEVVSVAHVRIEAAAVAICEVGQHEGARGRFI